MITNSPDTKVVYSPYVSVRPDKAVYRLVKETYIREDIDGFPSWVKQEKFKARPSTAEKPKVERKFHNFQISANSRKNLIEKILWLNQFAKSRTIKTYSGKFIYNFRTSFITLTLPASQVHNTQTITNECFDRFLTLLRNHLKMKNYVWKLEFQDNGNVHYHLITDTYVDYFYALKKWNNIVNKLGYVDRYQERMQSLTFAQYRQQFGNSDKFDVKTLASRYAKGKRDNWTQPNSIDVKAVRTNNNLHYYLSKYFAKNDDKKAPNINDNEDNSFGLRLCFWSRTLSKVSSQSMPEEYYNFDFYAMFDGTQNVVNRVYDYCRVAYFQITQLPDVIKRELYILFSQMKLNLNYVSAI